VTHWLAKRGAAVFRVAAAALLFTVPAWPAHLSAQQLAVKRPRITAITLACRAEPPTPQPAPQQRDEANKLSAQGEQSALEGDHKSAADFFARASALDPHDGTLAYRLGREKEELGDSATAVHEYCRYLALAPDAGDAKQVSDRILQLLPAPTLHRAEVVATAFQSGLGHYDARDWSGAEDAFTTAITADSALSAPVFDRALARENAHDAAGAIRDYNRYLALDPNAIDADSVRVKIEVYRHSAPSVGKAVALGILPGGGQFYTGQPILGVGVLAAAGAGIALAAQSTTVSGLVTKTYSFPFGGTYKSNVPITETQHQNAAAGLGVAAGVTIAGMIEAAVIAHHRSEAVSETTGLTLSPAVFPTPDGRLAVGLSLRP